MGDSLVLSQYLRTVMAEQVVLGKCTEAQRSHQPARGVSVFLGVSFKSPQSWFPRVVSLEEFYQPCLMRLVMITRCFSKMKEINV